eukprot:281033_1
MTTHNWWHVALLYLELDDLNEAVRILKTHVWRDHLDRRADQIGALSMCWILTMTIECNEQDGYLKIGDEIGEMWEIVMDYVVLTNENANVGYKLYDMLFIRGVIQMKARYNRSGSLYKYNTFDKRFTELRQDMIAFAGDDQELRDKYVGLMDAMVLMYGENASENTWNQAYKILSDIIDDLNIIGGSR